MTTSPCFLPSRILVVCLSRLESTFVVSCVMASTSYGTIITFVV